MLRHGFSVTQLTHKQRLCDPGDCDGVGHTVPLPPPGHREKLPSGNQRLPPYGSRLGAGHPQVGRHGAPPL